MIDANAKLGQLTSNHVGNLNAQPENDNGEHFHRYLMSTNSCAPSTHLTQTTAAYTYDTSDHNHRIDYITLPLTWLPLVITQNRPFTTSITSSQNPLPGQHHAQHSL